MSFYERTHFWTTSLVHWHLFNLILNPYKILNQAGLKSDHKVLEVGCGPGFFTLAAAKIVGVKGRIYALDLNPAAIEDIQKKVRQRRLKNVKTILSDATKTDLPDKSIDVAIFFGIIHAIEDMNTVLQEMYRILKPKGIVSAIKSRRLLEEELVQKITENRLFQLTEKTGDTFKFSKTN
jgi:ubiquinone/menaquinone biosynthesis C-methylase UbiE